MTIAAAGVACCYAGEPVDLQLKFKTGDRYEVELESTTEIVSTVDRRSRQIDSRVTLAMSSAVASVDDDGTASMRYTIDGLAVTAGPPGELGDRIVDFDTRAEKEIVRGISRELKSQATGLIGSSFVVTVSAAGETKNVSAIEMADEASLDPALAKLLNPEALGRLFRSTDIALPAEPVDAGDTWMTSRTIETAGLTVELPTQGLLITAIGNNAGLTFAAERDELIGETADGVRVVDAKITSDVRMDREAGYFTERDSVTQFKTESTYRDMTLETSVVMRTLTTTSKK